MSLFSLVLSAFAALSMPQEAREGMTPPARVFLDGPVVLAADLKSGWPTVQVMVDGKGPFTMILDTGASGVVIDEDLAAELGLPKVGTTRVGDPSNPEANLVDVIAVQSIELGALPEPDGREVIAFEREGQSPIVLQIDVGGHQVEAHLDSGNSRGISIPAWLKDELPIVAGTEGKVHARRPSGAVEFTRADLDCDIRIGNVVLSRPTVSFDTTLPFANIGGPFFEACVLTIDLANKRMRLALPENPRPAGARRIVNRSKGRRLGIQMSLSGNSELRVERVVPGSLAESVGLRAGDVLIAIDGAALSPADTSPMTKALSKGDAFKIEIERAGERLKIQVPAEKSAGKAPHGPARRVRHG